MTELKSESIELMKLPKKIPSSNTSSLFFNLNDYAKSRILYDMLYRVQSNCKESKEYLIAVLDDYAAKAISNFCSMFDLMQAGNIYQIEKLSKSRKRYPMSDAIYIISPSQQSINKLISDFPEEDQLDYDQYGSIHLCFLTQVPDEMLQKISKYPKLVNKVKTFIEVNIDFTVWQDNIFKIITKQTSFNELLNLDKTSVVIVEQLAQKLYTICSVMNEKPFIQYQGDSVLCEEVAMSVFKKLEYLFNYSSDAVKGEQVQYREPRGTLVIADRTFDMLTPLTHTYDYQSCVYDYLNVPEDGSLDQVIPPQHSKQRQAASENSHRLTEKDSVWQKYRTMHIAEVLGYLNDEIRALKQDQQNLKKLSDQEELHHDEIQKILQTIPEFEKRKAEVLIHLDLAQKVTDSMQNPKYNVMKLIEFEQTIISGVNDQGTPISENVMAKELTKVLKTLGRRQDRLRLICIYLLCYSLPDTDFKTVTKLVETKEEREILKLIRSYNKGVPGKRPERSIPQISTEDYRQYQNKYKEIQEMYDILRCQPQIMKVARDALNNDLDTTLFPFLGDEYLQQKSARGVNWHKNNENEEGRLILTVIGGLSHQEICAIQNLEKQMGISRMVIGSTQIITSQDFIDNLVPQKKKKQVELEESDKEEDFDDIKESIRRKRQKAREDLDKQKAISESQNLSSRGGKSKKVTKTTDEESDNKRGRKDQDFIVVDDIEILDSEDSNQKLKKDNKKLQNKKKKQEDISVDDVEVDTDKVRRKNVGNQKAINKKRNKNESDYDSEDDDQEKNHKGRKKNKNDLSDSEESQIVNKSKNKKKANKNKKNK